MAPRARDETVPAGPGPLPEWRLRHPLEPSIFLFTVALNLIVMAGALAVVMAGDDWVAGHPRIAEHMTKVRLVAIAALFVVPAFAVARNSRLGAFRGNTVRLSDRQVPLLHAILERHCARLGVRPTPKLYMTEIGLSEPARAFSAWGADYIVLSTRFNDGPLEEVRDLFEFTLGRELGRLRLGHTRG